MGSAAKKPVGYEKVYASGAGWKYDFKIERSKLQLISDAIGLKRGDAVLEIGCGEGFHSNVLYEMGYRVTGNELTEASIATARARHPLVNYIHGDTFEVMESLPREHFDMILARGHSWWHYRLVKDEKRGIDVPANTARLFELLKPGGHFVLAIRTDFTGTHPDGTVSNNAWQDYVDLFSPLGEVVYITDWLGTPLPDDAAARKSGKNIVIATRKPGGPRASVGARIRSRRVFAATEKRERKVLQEYEAARERRKQKPKE